MVIPQVVTVYSSTPLETMGDQTISCPNRQQLQFDAFTLYPQQQADVDVDIQNLTGDNT